MHANSLRQTIPQKLRQIIPQTTVWINTASGLGSVQYYAGSKPITYWSASDGALHIEHQDWVGTERLHTDSAGNKEATFASTPYGGDMTSASDNLNHFAGLDLDGSSGLGTHHAMFREYSSVTGRRASPDPYSGSYDASSPQSLNRYAYVQNSPLSLLDPTGLDPIDLGSCDEIWNETYSLSYNADDSSYNTYDQLLVRLCPSKSGQKGSGSGSTSGSSSGSKSTPSKSNAPSKAHSDCVKQALLSNAASLAIDAAGAVPPGVKGFGTLGRFVGQQRGFATIGVAYKGIVADQVGARGLQSLISSFGAASGLAGASDTSSLGLASTFLSGASLIGGAYVPILGQALSGAAFVVDGVKTYNAVQACPK